MEQIVRTPKQLGNALRRRRQEMALTQTALGSKTSLRQATISGIEKGEPGTQLRTLCDVLAALSLELVIRPRSKSSHEDIEDLF